MKRLRPRGLSVTGRRAVVGRIDPNTPDRFATEIADKQPSLSRHLSQTPEGVPVTDLHILVGRSVRREGVPEQGMGHQRHGEPSEGSLRGVTRSWRFRSRGGWAVQTPRPVPLGYHAAPRWRHRFDSDGRSEKASPWRPWAFRSTAGSMLDSTFSRLGFIGRCLVVAGFSAMSCSKRFSG